MQAGARSVSQPPTPTGRASAGDAGRMRLFSIDCQRNIATLFSVGELVPIIAIRTPQKRLRMPNLRHLATPKDVHRFGGLFAESIPFSCRHVPNQKTFETQDRGTDRTCQPGSLTACGRSHPLRADRISNEPSRRPFCRRERKISLSHRRLQTEPRPVIIGERPRCCLRS